MCDQNRPIKKTQGPDGCNYEFYQIYKKEVIAITLIVLKHTKEGLTPKPLSDASIILIPENEKQSQKRKLYKAQTAQRDKSFVNIDKK